MPEAVGTLERKRAEQQQLWELEHEARGTVTLAALQGLSQNTLHIHQGIPTLPSEILFCLWLLEAVLKKKNKYLIPAFPVFICNSTL